VKIAFYEPHLCLRGTTIAMFDYAFYNQTLLNNESIIIYDKNHPATDLAVVEKFKKEFKCIEINSILDLDNILNQENSDFIYILKGGFKDSRVSKNTKMLIHATSMAKPEDVHGHKFAYVSEWMSKICSGGTLPYIPHMINLPDTEESLRKELNIPEEAIVFGRTGGIDTWNISFVNNVIFDVLQKRKDIFFIFQNTNLPFSHSNIIHIPTSADPLYKVKFINSCDAFLHARQEGESFGIACGEFSSKNKPIITWYNSIERNHIEILSNKGIYYKKYEELFSILLNFCKNNNKDWNCYKEYTPEIVIKKFNDVFLRE